MRAACPVIHLDSSYDLRVLSALPDTLALFPQRELEAQLEDMTRQRRAICFTLIARVRRAGTGAHAAKPDGAGSTAVVLVCLHVAPELAIRGFAALLTTLRRTATLDAVPMHEIAAPLTRAGHSETIGCYREAVYGDEDAYVAITTHTPAEIPPEAATAVAAATRGGPVDIVTTVAVTPYRPDAVTPKRRRRSRGRQTLH